MHAAVVDTTDDGRLNYDAIEIASPGPASPVLLRAGEWTDWMPVVLRWNDKDVASHVRLQVIRLDDTYRDDEEDDDQALMESWTPRFRR